MPWPKSSIPKFGNWDRNEDISYSIVFDKVRAEKEAALQSLEEDDDNSLSSRKKTSQRFPEVSARQSKESFSQATEENGRSAISHQRGNSKQLTEKARLHDKNYDSSSAAFSSWQAAVSRDHQCSGSELHSHNLHACPQKNVAACAHNPVVSCVPSTQSGATTNRYHPSQDHEAFRGRLHGKLSGSGRHCYEEELTDTKPRYPSGGSFDMQQRGSTVPKFGNWENEDGYSTVFDNMRKERSSKQSSRRSIVRLGQLQMDQDCYKGPEQMKHSRSWLSIICCTKPYPEGY